MKTNVMVVTFLCFTACCFAGEGDAGVVPIVAEVIHWLLGAVGTALGGYLLLLVDKFVGIKNKEIKEKILLLADRAIRMAINKAELWASKKKDKPSSQEKLNHAIELAIKFADEFGVGNYVKERAEDLIEDYLADNGMNNSLLKKKSKASKKK